MNIHSIRSCVLSALLLFALALPMRSMADDAAVKPADNAAPAAATVTADAAKPAEAAPAAAEKKEEAAEAEKQEEAAPKSRFSGKAWALLPPLVAIILALITKEVYSSLFIGIVLGGCLAAEFKFLKMMDLIINDGFISAVKDTAGVFIFLVILGIIVALMNQTGAAQAFGEWAKKHVKSRVGAAIMTFILGVLIFIDDYFNCLTVGSVMLPVTDSKRISRAKLAYLIDATAAPICMIAPISSWAAAVSSYASGTNYNGIELFCKAIPYNFYSLLTIIFILAITFMKLDFGPMARHEKNAIENGDLFTEGKEVDNGIKASSKVGRVSDLIIPVVILIAICFFALVYNGGFLGGKSFIDAFADTDATVALPWGGMLALVVIILFYIARNILEKNPTRPFMPYVVGNKEAMECIGTGFGAMVPPILILTLATALKNMTGLLEAKEYIAAIMGNAAQGLHSFLPVIIFLVACVLAFATGTSWGTFGILIPIVVNVFPATSPLLYIGMSACLAGAVCGDHCSPISDTTIMSSAGARCQHINHVSTQLPYAIYVAVVSAIGFLLAGFKSDWFVVFPVTVLVLLAGLFVIKAFKKN